MHILLIVPGYNSPKMISKIYSNFHFQKWCCVCVVIMEYCLDTV